MVTDRSEHCGCGATASTRGRIQATFAMWLYVDVFSRYRVSPIVAVIGAPNRTHHGLARIHNLPAHTEPQTPG